MATKEQCEAQAIEFGNIWDGKLSIWGYAIGASPSQYDEYGTLPKSGPRDFGFHVYTTNMADVDKIPNMWNDSIPVMVFVDVESEE